VYYGIPLRMKRDSRRRHKKVFCEKFINEPNAMYWILHDLRILQPSHFMPNEKLFFFRSENSCIRKTRKDMIKLELEDISSESDDS